MSIADDFSLDRSDWFNTMKLDLACKHIRTQAEVAAERAPLLINSANPETGKVLADAETSLSEALQAVKLANRQFKRRAA